MCSSDLVRLIRSTISDKRLANVFHLENIDVLDYRIAANILETTSDTLVEIANSLSNTTLSKNDLKKISLEIDPFYVAQ